MTLVLDASAGIAVVRDEPRAEWVRNLIAQAAARSRRTVVPATFWTEVVNVLGRRYRYAGDDILAAVATLDALELITIESERPGLLAVIDVCVRDGLSTYDATYLAMAEALEADLLTLDNGLAAAAGGRALYPGGHRISDERAGYRLQPWISWVGAAEYLDAIRLSAVSST